jgi:CBS domain-containing protein
MKAREIMTSNVRTIGPDATIVEIAATLLDHRISGMPVVEDGRVIGIVSEGDLIHREEIGTGTRRLSWWKRPWRRDRSPVDYIKVHGVTARDVMTHPAITVTEDTPLNEIADLFGSRRIKRVPVERDGRLVGIISRADLLQALARRVPARRPIPAYDEDIRTALMDTLKAQPWWQQHTSHVMVSNGVVHIWGLDGTTDERDAARIAALNVAGVRKVEDHRIARRNMLEAE